MTTHIEVIHRREELWIDYFREAVTTRVVIILPLNKLWIDYFREAVTTFLLLGLPAGGLWIDYFRGVDEFRGRGCLMGAPSFSFL